MENRLLFEANELLRYLTKLRKRMSRRMEQLAKYEGWTLKRESSRSKDHNYYDVSYPASREKKYLGNETHPDVLNVKRYRYANESMSVLDTDIKLLEDLIDNYVSPDYQSINSRLPATYQTSLSKKLSSEVSSEGAAEGSSALRNSRNTSVSGTSLTNTSLAGTSLSAFDAMLPEEALIWKQKLEQEKARYPLYKPEQLKHPALDGTMMRSKSEVIIANILLLSGIPFVYEVPLFIDGEMVLPDFTILSLIDLKTELIIEHQGIIYEDDYAEKYIRSLRSYLRSAWIPNKNLFFTFDDARETLDVRQVMSILRKFVSPSVDLPASIMPELAAKAKAA